MPKNKNRDDFSPATKRAIERQARGHCSNPACRRLTRGASSDGQGEISIGEAAHICAAAEGGPRYDPNMTPEQRMSADNGIWLCDVHARAVDAKDSKFTPKLLREWKKKTNEDSWRSIIHNIPYGPAMQTPTLDELTERLRAAASEDLNVFRRTARWPSTAVALTLKIPQLAEALATRALAEAVIQLDDLILVAAPGMGKTTTLFQIAEGVLATAAGTALVVPLADWATDGSPLLACILRRPAFCAISELDFRAVAAKPGVVVLLDGWNELDAASRQRARVQVATLKAELPELGLVVSSRKQALDVPLSGTHVDLLPLDHEQQMEIATAMRGEAGAKIVDQAWRTPGVRELVTIPLYLTSLLSLPDSMSFPTTKEEVLRRFVGSHEADARRAEVLRTNVHDLQQHYLEALAVHATTAANTAITEVNARQSISVAENALVANGQLTTKSQPDAVLDVLISTHVLMRSGEPRGYSFQHQQFQEWYASHFVERLMLRAPDDAAVHAELKAQVLDLRPWEEAVLFATERLARGDTAQQRACGTAILAALEVDPLLAADMIFRSTDPVWALVSRRTQALVRAWHNPGKLDRAVRFMITSGRPEFHDLVWPLITHANDQIHLGALRAAARFRPSVLRVDAPTRIAALPTEIRKHVLREIASNSAMDGLDLATAIAKAEPDPEVKATVIDALAFRRADRHVVEVLDAANEQVFDLICSKAVVDHVSDADVQARLQAAHERQRKGGITHTQRLRSIINAELDTVHATEVTAVVAQMEIDRQLDADRHLLYEVRQRYPQALADGLLDRLRHGRTLFYGADDVLASADYALEEEPLLDIALADTRRNDDRAEAAASVLGPLAVGRMVEECLQARKRVRDTNGRYDQAASERYNELRSRIRHTPAASLLAAVQKRAATTDNAEITELADLLCRPYDDERGRPFSQDALTAIQVLVQDWAERMLASGDAAHRSQTATLATLISHAPSASLLPLLKRLLDDNLHRYCAFRAEAKATGWRPGKAKTEAQWPNTQQYQQAFMAIKAPETAELMKTYLTDQHFGSLAAAVLASHWIDAHEPKDNRRFRSDVDFARLEGRRAARAADPTVTSHEAEAIFGAIETLIADGSTDDQRRLAVALGVIAARLPHGQRQSTIDKLIALTPRQSRAALLLSLLLSGESIAIGLVVAGIAETFEAAKKETWILTQSDGYELREWLRLLPLVDHPLQALALIRGMPDQQRNPRLLEQMVSGLGVSPSPEAEELLLKLAEDDARFYANHTWRDAILQRDTLTAARRFIDLAAQGVLEARSTDAWHLARQIAGLMRTHPELRSYVYALLTATPRPPASALLMRAFAENPDADSLLLLIAFESEQKRALVDWRALEHVVTTHMPSEHWVGAYDVVPIPAVELRKHLLELLPGNDSNHPAARCLNNIDKIRDHYGAPESEPRHPNLASGRAWPIIKPDPDAEGE